MAIERLSFPQHLNIQSGVQLSDVSPEQLMRVVRKFGSRGTRRLAEGEYDLTPPIWQRPTYSYNLTVMDSGIGIVRMIPRYPDSTSSFVDREAVYDVRIGGRQIRLPEDQSLVVVLGPNRLNPSICLYEFVYFVPDSNPA